MAYFNERLMVVGLRWTARILGIALAAPGICIVVWEAIQHGVLNPFTTSLHDDLIVVAMWTMTLGLLVGWKWEGVGGLLTIAGVAMSGIVDDRNWPQVQFVAGLAAGLLYLVCWWRERRLPVGEMESGTAAKVLKRFSIPLVLIATHAVLVALVALSIKLSSEPEAGMGWIMFVIIDFPLSHCINLLPPIFSTDALFPWTVLGVGTVQWGIVGLVLQLSAMWIHQTAKWFRR